MSVLQKADVGMIENGYAQKAETGQMRPNAAVHEWLRQAIWQHELRVRAICSRSMGVQICGR